MWFIMDGLGISLGLLTWALLAFADWVVVRHVLVAWFWTPRPRFSWLPLTDVGALVTLAYQILLFLSWLSHFQAMTTDPGTVREQIAPPHFANGVNCKLCQNRWKPPRAHHCKTCHRCIFRMDHHCPWINNCVGLSNQKLFILFLGYTALSAVVTLVLLASSAICWLWSQKSWSDAAPPGSAALICSGVVAVECLAAVLFVGDFLQEQIESIQMNSTLVETYQRTHGERSTFLEHFRSVFGRSWWAWPWPFPSAAPPRYTEPAIPDDAGFPVVTGNSETDGLGIAGEESEAATAGHSKPLLSGAPNEGLRLRYEGASRTSTPSADRGLEGS
mmetsp:Transcript_142790/g.397754  ORF Transcript_142790/g.397754 Transcript_142790/m.397754 type:complete len:331 (+) Transcript_142790:130-1122(+)